MAPLTNSHKMLGNFVLFALFSLVHVPAMRSVIALPPAIPQMQQLQPSDANLKIAFIGDTAYGENFRSVLRLIEAENADALIHLGDFDYVYDADGFFGVINSVLGEGYPYFVAVGNHDIDTWAVGCGDSDGCYAQFAIERLQRLGITPDDWNLNDQMYALTYRGVKLVFAGQTTSQADPVYAPYLNAQLAADQHIWRVCAWHKNQQAMQIGGKPDEMGWNPYEVCRQRGAIIATAHEHSYSRTRTLSDMSDQTVDPAYPTASDLMVKPGSTFAFVSGLGGQSIRPQLRCLPATFPYGCKGEWASIYASNQSAQYGALFITFNVDGDPYRASGYFKAIDGHVIDQFDIRTQANGAPPTRLTVELGGAAEIDLIWQDNSSDESSFRIERSPDGSAGWVEIASNAANDTTYSDANLPCGIYYYRVRGHRASDDQYSGYTDTDYEITVPCNLFDDVPTQGKEWMQPYIETFYLAGLTSGCDPQNYCPETPVTRGTMAVFLLRALNYPNLPYTPTDVEPDIFTDVPVAGKEWMEPWIEAFYNLGITGGCGVSPLRFCPENSVTRAALAVFILRAIEGPGYTPPASSNLFADLPVAGKEWMEPWVNEFYNRGFTTGCGIAPLRYCPENPVTRGAMAVFILRAFENLPEP